MNYVFAGDREISCNILKFLIAKGYSPLGLMLRERDKSSHASQLIEISGLDDDKIIFGNDFKSPGKIEFLQGLNLDYIIGIHFPYVVPKSVLGIPKIGVLNLHPAYLPFNKGWHTPSWAIMDKTPFGATLHFMDELLDQGDIIHQKTIDVDPADTANSLYSKVLKLEEAVFYEAFEEIRSLRPSRLAQLTSGTSYSKKDLKIIQKLNLDDKVLIADILNKLRALTTNDINEAAFFIENGKKYAVQVQIKEVVGTKT